MFEIPGHQILYPLNRRNGNVQGVARFGLRYGALHIECSRQLSRLVGYREKGQAIEDIHSLPRGRGIPIAAFINNKL